MPQGRYNCRYILIHSLVSSFTVYLLTVNGLICFVHHGTKLMKIPFLIFFFTDRNGSLVFVNVLLLVSECFCCFVLAVYKLMYIYIIKNGPRYPTR